MTKREENLKIKKNNDELEKLDDEQLEEVVGGTNSFNFFPTSNEENSKNTNNSIGIIAAM